MDNMITELVVAVALYNYNAQRDKELDMQYGDKIAIIKVRTSFPRNFKK